MWSSDLHRQRPPIKTNPSKLNGNGNGNNMRSMNSDKDDEKAMDPPTYHGNHDQTQSRHQVPSHIIPTQTPSTYYSNGNSRDTTSNGGGQTALNTVSMTQSEMDSDHGMTRKVAPNVNVEETFYGEEYSNISPQQNGHSTNAMNMGPMDTTSPDEMVNMDTVNGMESMQSMEAMNQTVFNEAERVNTNPVAMNRNQRNPVSVERVDTQTANAVNAMNHAAVPPHRAVQAQTQLPVQNRNVVHRADHGQRVESSLNTVKMTKPPTFDQTPIKQHQQQPPVQQQQQQQVVNTTAVPTKGVNTVTAVTANAPPKKEVVEPVPVQNQYGDFIASSFGYHEQSSYREKPKKIEPVETEEQIRER